MSASTRHIPVQGSDGKIVTNLPGAQPAAIGAARAGALDTPATPAVTPGNCDLDRLNDLFTLWKDEHSPTTSDDDLNAAVHVAARIMCGEKDTPGMVAYQSDTITTDSLYELNDHLCLWAASHGLADGDDYFDEKVDNATHAAAAIMSGAYAHAYDEDDSAPRCAGIEMQFPNGVPDRFTPDNLHWMSGYVADVCCSDGTTITLQVTRCADGRTLEGYPWSEAAGSVVDGAPPLAIDLEQALFVRVP